MGGLIEHLYVFDALNRPVIRHVFAGRPVTPSAIAQVLSLRPAPRPPIVHDPALSITIVSLELDGLLFTTSSPLSSTTQCISQLQFLRLVARSLALFLGEPIVSSKIEENYDVVIQMLSELCDGGLLRRSEPDVLRDGIEGREGWLGKVLSGVTIPGQDQLSRNLRFPNPRQPPQEHTHPWRRQNVRHTNNEVFVTISERINVIIAPSGRVVTAASYGKVVVNSQLSGVPDLSVTLSSPGGRVPSTNFWQHPSFHACVRQDEWRKGRIGGAGGGVLNLVPPDGRCEVMGYEVDLMPNALLGSSASDDLSSAGLQNEQRRLKLPVQVDVGKQLDGDPNNFEVKVLLDQTFPGWTAAKPPTGDKASSSLGAAIASRLSQASSSLTGVSSVPVLSNIQIAIPVPSNLDMEVELKPSKGETEYAPGDDRITWFVPAQETVKSKTELVQFASLKVRFSQALVDEEIGIDARPAMVDIVAGFEEYIPNSEPVLLEEKSNTVAERKKKSKDGKRRKKKKRVLREKGTPSGSRTPEQLKQASGRSDNSATMPRDISVSFEVAGWLVSGTRVEEIRINAHASRGLGESVKPFKGVRYLTRSERGLELRC